MKVWKFFSGYVNIWIMGEYPEKLINLLNGAGIRLFNCERRPGGVAADVLIKDFQRMRPIVRRSGARVRVASRHGAPLVLSAVWRAPVFFAALLLFTAAAAFASGRLWFIRVETVSVPEEEVVGVLDSLGVRIGARKGGIRTNELSNRLCADSRVVNAKVVLKGVTLTVTLSESEAVTPGESGGAPAGVYADKDCVIRFIMASRGHAQAAEGMAVKEGDLLISGDLSGVKDGFMVRADGMVLGEVLYVAQATAERSEVKRVRSGSNAPVVGARLFGRELLLSTPFDDYELELCSEKSITASPLPVGIREYLCCEMVLRLVPDSEEGTRARAALMAQEKLYALLPQDAKIITINTRYAVNDDGSVTAVIAVTAVERIGIRREY